MVPKGRAFPDFHKAEYEALRAEILQSAKQIDSLVAFGIAAAGATAAWLSANGDKASWIFWCGPFAIVLMTFGYYYGRFHSIGLIGQYLKKLEENYRDNENLGWESFWDKRRPNSKALWSERITWFFLFGGSALFFLFKVWPLLPHQS